MGLRIFCKKTKNEYLEYYCTYQYWNNLKKGLSNKCIDYIETRYNNLDINEDNLYIENNLDLLNELQIHGIHNLITKPDNECEYSSEESTNIILMCTIINEQIMNIEIK